MTVYTSGAVTLKASHIYMDTQEVAGDGDGRAAPIKHDLLTWPARKDNSVVVHWRYEAISSSHSSVRGRLPPINMEVFSLALIMYTVSLQEARVEDKELKMSIEFHQACRLA